MSHLLSRYAEAAFWLGRYMERAESLSRVIDVADTFSRSSRGVADWNAVLALYADEDAYRQRHGDVSAGNVIYFYVLDRGNPGSIISSVQAARENARALRPMISSEAWEQLNTFHNEMKQLERDALASPSLYRLCRRIKERCQTHAGVVDATLYRDETWYFRHVGAILERAAQTAHYLDVRYRDVQPGGDDDVEAYGRWTALLRSQAALHGYRQTRRSDVSPRGVVAFLLFDRRFPRSVASCLEQLDGQLHTLRREFGLAAGAASIERSSGLLERFTARRAAEVIESGLHDVLDAVQRELYALSDLLYSDFFGRTT